MSFTVLKPESALKPLQCDHQRLFNICKDLMTIVLTNHKIVILKEENGFFYPETHLEKKVFGKSQTDKNVAFKICEFFEANKEQSADYVEAIRKIKKNFKDKREVKQAFRDLLDKLLVFSGRKETVEEIQILKTEGIEELINESEKIKTDITRLKGEKKKLQEEVKLLQEYIDPETRSLLQEHKIKELSKDKRIKRLSLQIIQKHKSMPLD